MHHALPNLNLTLGELWQHNRESRIVNANANGFFRDNHESRITNHTGDRKRARITNSPRLVSN